jgi:hypothetical protein
MNLRHRYFVFWVLALALVLDLKSGVAQAGLTSEPAKEYFYFGRQQTNLMGDWESGNTVDFSVVLSAMNENLAILRQRKESLPNQLLFTAGIIQRWFSELTKSIHPRTEFYLELGFLPNSASLYFEPEGDIEMNKALTEVKTCREARECNSEELALEARRNMPSVANNGVANFREFELKNEIPRDQIQIIGGFLSADARGRMPRAQISLVLSLPRVVEPLKTELSGWGFLDQLVIPASQGGGAPVYAILELDLIANLDQTTSFSPELIETPLRFANLKVNFGTRVLVKSGVNLNKKNPRMAVFVAERPKEHNLDLDAESWTFTPKERVPYLRVSNLKIPERTLDIGLLVEEGIHLPAKDSKLFDFGFLKFFGFEIDLIKLEILHIEGDISVYDKDQTPIGRGRVNYQHKLQSSKLLGLGWGVSKDDWCVGFCFEEYIVSLLNKLLSTQKEDLRQKIREKVNEAGQIGKGVLGAVGTKAKSKNYESYSRSLPVELCASGALAAEDEVCQNSTIQNLPIQKTNTQREH